MEHDEISKKRSRGGQLDIGDDSEGAIERMVNIGERTFVIKNRGIYELILADDIDPKRTNINVPNMVHKLVLSQGIDSVIVSQIFLTALMFFKKGSFPEKELSRIWELIVELTKEAINLKKHLTDYYEKERLANEKYNLAKSKGLAPALPTIEDLDTSLKTIFQKGHHMYQIMIELSSTILDKINLSRTGHFATFQTLITNTLGEQHGFSIFLTENLDFMKTILAFRNGLDHRSSRTVTVQDYQFNPDTSISLPTIRLNAKDAKLSETSVSDYLQVMEGIFSFAEVLICHLANISIKQMLGGEIREIPEKVRVYKHVRYCFYLPGLNFYQQ